MSSSSINIKSNQVSGNNIGSGSTFYTTNTPFNTLNFKSLSVVNNGALSLDSTGDTIILSANTNSSSSGEVNTGSNVGIGQGLFFGKSGTELQFRTIIGSGTVSLSTNVAGNQITISGLTNTVAAAGDDSQIQFNLNGVSNSGGTLTSSSSFTFSGSTQSLTIGNRAGASGFRSFAQGTDNTASGCRSFAQGRNNIASGENSFAQGCCSCSLGVNSVAMGYNTRAIGEHSHAEGFRTIACRLGAHAGGKGSNGGKEVIAGGYYSFNHSTNTGLQIAGHGANAIYSAILGGLNNNIEIGSYGSVIIGGYGIKLTGTTHSYHTAVENLAIWSPSNDTTSPNLLTWNPTTRKVGFIAKSNGSITSDARLKSDVAPINNINLEGICGVSFKFNNKTPENGTCSYGVIAQEIEKYFPLAVNSEGVEYNNELYKTVDYYQLIPILLNKIKELEIRVKELENK